MQVRTWKTCQERAGAAICSLEYLGSGWAYSQVEDYSLEERERGKGERIRLERFSRLRQVGGYCLEEKGGGAELRGGRSGSGRTE